ncbi:DUF5990 family protein [Streptomyces sp. NPDC090025]|uniref:DUF5990 family protein n=1 Tax=Streptomyces sp. NPDC090025 TaxID=3365922 RepID=UPI0038373A3C
MQIRIEADRLPGLSCAPAPGYPGHTGIHVAVQRRARPAELLAPQPGDAPSAAWTLDCVVTETATGGHDIKGPYVQGGPGGRFVYLSWVSVGQDGTATMFRRAKLMLDAVPERTVRAAVGSGVLLGRLGLTDVKGQPLCAAVRPPRIDWTAAAPAD